MPKPNYLLKHFSDPQRRDQASPIILCGDERGRLGFRYTVNEGDWDTVARFVSGANRWPVAWIPDANVAFLDATGDVWEVLRAVALGNRNGSTVITGVVEAEMGEWLDLPYRNQKRAANIKAALEGETWIKKFRVTPTDPFNLALYGYTHLLGFRRFATQKTDAGTTMVNTDPADKSSMMNAIRNKLGPRAQGLAKKGREDAEGSGAINISDEMNVMMAVLYALRKRRNSVILTADVDYVEIFYKTQWFLDTHYRAWLAAKMIKDGRYGYPVGQLIDTEGYFDSPLTLYKRPTYHLREVLPPNASAVHVSLLYVSPDRKLHLASFPFELEMLKMLRTRSGTDGRCTDLLGDANLHVDLGPLKRTMEGVHLGIGKDVTTRFVTNEISCRVARLDLEHSVCCFERFITC